MFNILCTYCAVSVRSPSPPYNVSALKKRFKRVLFFFMQTIMYTYIIPRQTIFYRKDTQGILALVNLYKYKLIWGQKKDSILRWRLDVWTIKLCYFFNSCSIMYYYNYLNNYFRYNIWFKMVAYATTSQNDLCSNVFLYPYCINEPTNLLKRFVKKMCFMLNRVIVNKINRII